MTQFWENLPRPFFALAPMEDVTDAAFRALIARYGKPNVFFTEFTSADGLVLAPEKGQQQLRRKLLFSEAEHSIVAQLFTAFPEHMERAAALCASLGFDGIDINMGCPDRAIEKGLCGAAMIKNPALAKDIIRAGKRGAAGLPVSVKTRIGYNTDEIDTWIPAILEEHPAALTVHLRTRKEMSDVPAHWELMPRIVALKESISPATVLLGNGDLESVADARNRVAIAGCDGAMLGRAIYGNPWLFAHHTPAKEERINALIEHIGLFETLLGDVVNFATMKKHFKAYISGWDNAKELRMQLMDTDCAPDAIAILESAVH